MKKKSKNTKRIRKSRTKPNRKYKDSVFVDLFIYYKDSIVLLYNALQGANIKEGTKVENIALENSLYTTIRNDVSFLIENTIIVLIEHQSTINKNMPLRLLLYVAEIYKNILDEKIRYSREQEFIPLPVFYVFYNGKEAYPERDVLHLSDAYRMKIGEAQLELEVNVVNINYGKNEELMRACNILKEYSMFVKEVREHVEKCGEEGFSLAIKYCIENGILSEYLSKRFKAVENMLMSEYNYEMDIAVQRNEEHRLAYEEGMAMGEERGEARGISIGEARGKSMGEAKKQKDIALNLLAMDFSIEQVSKATGLSIEDVEALI